MFYYRLGEKIKKRFLSLVVRPLPLLVFGPIKDIHFFAASNIYIITMILCVQVVVTHLI